jgi:tRNA wybutosine-synthesizing protein 1
MQEKIRQGLEKQHYGVVGGHSAVKVCHWTRKALENQGACYKERFYPELVKSHRCLQMTPWITCNMKCRFCWRIIERTALPQGLEPDEPGEIIDSCIRAQKKLISGFKGFEGTDLGKWKQAQRPNNAAISLLGEPLLYPGISGLIEEFRKRGINTLMVSSGQNPEVLEEIREPDQLYLSLDAPDQEACKRLNRPGLPDFWERLGKSLELMNSLSCRRVLRLTLVKGWNMGNARGYAKLIEKANPDFLEVKGYMHVGESQKRLPMEAMPLHPEVRAFSEELARECGYQYKDEHRPSRVVLLRA